MAIVARAFDVAPRTTGQYTWRCVRGRRTEGLPRPQVGLAREEARLETLVRAVGDGRVDYENQTRLEPPPQPGDPIRPLDDLVRRGNEPLAVLLLRRLLPCRDDGNGDGERLCDGARKGPQRQLDGRGRRGGGLGVLVVHRPHDGVPVEVGEVCGRDAEERAVDARVEAQQAVLGDDAADGVPCRGVVLYRGVDRVLVGADLDLQARLDAGLLVRSRGLGWRRLACREGRRARWRGRHRWRRRWPCRGERCLAWIGRPL